MGIGYHRYPAAGKDTGCKMEGQTASCVVMMRESLEKAQEALRESGVRGRYVPSENLHLTLAFLGEVKDPAPVISALSSLSFRPFMIGTGACIGHFGDLLWAGLEDASGSGALSRLCRFRNRALCRGRLRWTRPCR